MLLAALKVAPVNVSAAPAAAMAKFPVSFVVPTSTFLNPS